jgi:hypothetical protein
MDKKEQKLITIKTSIATTIVIALAAISFTSITIVTISSLNPFGVALAQDLNPPTTGTTTPNVTSTFGTNTTAASENMTTK